MSYSNIVEKVRAFNRFYMPAMNLLGNHYLGSEYSVTEARVFFEIYQSEGCNAAHIARVMNIDKSYLSKILAGYEKSGYLWKVSSARDRRAWDLFLTEKGKQRAEELIRKSNEEIEAILRELSAEDRLRMEQAFDTIIELLQKGGCYNENRSI
ncbi:transcriptional regulator, MarR family [Marvinbryantia formatexigens DSM 14469]|uniref:Transcriptional regulator, MarR family n=1 Tax=Marvinbryantia formatexigens DSM 14469 TaxID=478749 RepID=C6LIY5_9FIRM|nr:MarR family transcriptional regulator [Marvinbryantia formatexigens]EET59524.1 transcriptional regulator, MarR family [Marvinbryantia formatexigens DSM 14469]UWO24002.1 MarR family transcriptional regulator [Marvinbryantia formatexigens DSM 14469]SDG66986.1 DNA-binding transcriptional regulator, MarR family [Marvinbryantia formatexigens]